MVSSGWSVKTKQDEGRMEGRGATICHIHCPPPTGKKALLQRINLEKAWHSIVLIIKKLNVILGDSFRIVNHNFELYQNRLNLGKYSFFLLTIILKKSYPSLF